MKYFWFAVFLINCVLQAVAINEDDINRRTILMTIELLLLNVSLFQFIGTLYLGN